MCSACGIPPRLTFPSSSILPSPWMRPAHYSVLSRCRYNWNRQSCSPPCRCAQSPSAWPPSARSKSSSSGMDLRWGIQFAAPCIIKCALAAGRPARTRQGVGRKSKIKSRQDISHKTPPTIRSDPPQRWRQRTAQGAIRCDIRLILHGSDDAAAHLGPAFCRSSHVRVVSVANAMNQHSLLQEMQAISVRKEMRVSTSREFSSFLSFDVSCSLESRFAVGFPGFPLEPLLLLMLTDAAGSAVTVPVPGGVESPPFVLFTSSSNRTSGLLLRDDGAPFEPPLPLPPSAPFPALASS